MTGLLRIGFLADGVVKLLVASAYGGLRVPLAQLLGASAGLLLLTAVLVAASGVAEVVYAVRSGAGSHTRYLIVYDGGWLLVTVGAALIGIGEGRAGGGIWLLAQALGSLGIAIVFVRGAVGPRA
ncbi:hypothetical protein [Brachybacterium hainanense]|uniref:Uncharacterized protein n=1 Tax=Brachybacterium hainanense TaxID=1541174 RepID=A0ABV6R7S3_9MICO